MGPAFGVRRSTHLSVGDNLVLESALPGAAPLGSHDGLDGGLVSVLQLCPERREVGPKLDEGADPEASNEVPTHAHVGAVSGSPKEPPGDGEGLSGRHAQGAIEFFGQ